MKVAIRGFVANAVCDRSRRGQGRRMTIPRGRFRRARSVQIARHCASNCGNASSGIMFGPSLIAFAGSGCVSMKRPSAPARAPPWPAEAQISVRRCSSRRPPRATARRASRRNIGRVSVLRHDRERAHVHDEVLIPKGRARARSAKSRWPRLHAACRSRAPSPAATETGLSSRSPCAPSPPPRAAGRSGGKGTPESAARRTPPRPCATCCALVDIGQRPESRSRVCISASSCEALLRFPFRAAPLTRGAVGFVEGALENDGQLRVILANRDRASQPPRGRPTRFPTSKARR